MKKMQQINQRASALNDCENWAFSLLRSTPLKWTRQAIWGCRIFDFWCAEKGFAIEVDGAGHKPDYDSHRDKYNFLRSGIIVRRVKNFDEVKLKQIVAEAISVSLWIDRRDSMGLNSNTKRQRRNLVIEAGMKLAHGDWEPK